MSRIGKKSKDKLGDAGLSGFLMNRIVVASLLFLVSFAVFIPSLKNDFVWDDLKQIRGENYSFKLYDTHRALMNPESRHYRPLLYNSFQIDKFFWSNSPFGSHFFNVILFSISTILFYFFSLLVLREFDINKKDAVAFLSSLFFSVYPVHIEAVSFIPARGDLICGIFILKAYIFHTLSFKRFWFLVLSAIGFVLSLLSKEVAVILPFLLVVFDLLSRRFMSKVNIIRYGVYALFLIGYFYIRFEALEGFFDRLFSNLSLTGLISANAYDLSSNLASLGLQESTEKVSIGGITQPIQFLSRVWSFSGIILGSYLFYLKKLIYPYSLNPYTANIPNGIPNLLTSIIVLLLMILFSIRSIFRGKGVIAFCIFWILLSLGPLSVIANVTKGTLAASPLAERFLFIPSIGFCLLLGYLLIELIDIIKYKKLVWTTIILIAVTYVVFTIIGQRVWKDDLALWSFAIEKNPDENVPHINYGQALLKVGRKKEAIEQYLIPLNPSAKDKKTGITLAANNLALIYLELGDFEEAEKWFIKALDFNRLYRPRFDANMGTLYFLKAERNYNRGNDYQSDYEQAERYLSKAVKRKHDDGRMQLYLAKAYLRIGNNEKARIHAEIAIKSKSLNRELHNVAESILKHTE